MAVQRPRLRRAPQDPSADPVGDGAHTRRLRTGGVLDPTGEHRGMTNTSGTTDELDPGSSRGWARSPVPTRWRSPGTPAAASRAGHAIDAEFPDGTSSGALAALRSRVRTAVGHAATHCWEAAVYRALGPTPMRVAAWWRRIPPSPRSCMERVDGASRFAQIADPRCSWRSRSSSWSSSRCCTISIPTASTSPSWVCPARSVSHVLDEIVEWESQYAAAGGGVPVITLACVAARPRPRRRRLARRAGAGRHRARQLHVRRRRLVAITDWELAHWGDLHDDLAWILVRDTLERFPDLAARLRDYEAASGFPHRSRTTGLLPRARAAAAPPSARSPDCAATTDAARSRGADLQHVAHAGARRVLGRGRRAFARRRSIPSDDGGSSSWVFDIALDDLRDVVVPALAADPFAATRAKGIARR